MPTYSSSGTPSFVFESDQSQTSLFNQYEAERDRRDCNVYVVSSTGSIVAGFLQHESLAVSVRTFYRWLSQVIVVDEIDGRHQDDWRLRRLSGSRFGEMFILERDDENVMEMGTYVIASIHGTPLFARTVRDRYQPRIFSGTSTPKTFLGYKFRYELYQRDRCCQITGKKLTYRDDGNIKHEQVAEGAHILHVNYKPNSHFHHRGFDLRSLDNGLVMLPLEHRSFNSYDLAIDVDDDYRIINFSNKGLASSLPRKHICPCSTSTSTSTCMEPSPETIFFLREHFRNSLLKHLKGELHDHVEFPEFASALRHKAVNLEDLRWSRGDGKLALEDYLAMELWGVNQEIDKEWEKWRNGRSREGMHERKRNQEWRKGGLLRARPIVFPGKHERAKGFEKRKRPIIHRTLFEKSSIDSISSYLSSTATI